MPATTKASRHESEHGDQPGDDDRAQRRAERRAAVEQGRAAAALVLRHPDRVELAAGRIDRRLRGAEAQAGQQQRTQLVQTAAMAWKKPQPSVAHGDDDARLEAVGQHAARNLHERVGPEEGAAGSGPAWPGPMSNSLAISGMATDSEARSM